MRAFILRRLELIRRGYGNIILMGSHHSSQTLQLREFLSRYYLPFYSMRYQGQMNWDVTLPATIGYFTTFRRDVT